MTARYTLVIPTCNRPRPLRRLLDYLGARGFKYGIKILDSSTEPALSANRQAVAASRLNIVYETYDNAMHPYVKFALGVQSIETPYCSFCADDDVLFTASVEGCLDSLSGNPSFAAAHGLYVNFAERDAFNVTYTVYDSPSIADDDGLKRIVTQMGNYQAIFYAVYRTPVLQSVLQSIRAMEATLYREMLASTLTLVAGGVRRLPQFYMARNTAPSIILGGWHPHQILATDPERLFREYAAYRAVALERLNGDPLCRERYGPDRIRKAFDLVHLKYLEPLLTRPVIDFMIKETLRPDRTAEDIIEGVWKTFVFSGRPEHAQRRWRRLRSLLARLHRRMRFPPTAPPKIIDYSIDTTTRTGTSRRYLLLNEFLYRELAGGRRIDASDVDTLVEHLNDYV